VDGYPVHPSGKANPGDTINYTVTITNTGDAAATGVTFTDNVDTNTSLVNGSVSTQPLAFNDNFSALGNVQIDVPVASGLIVNDRDPDVGNGTSSGLTITAIGADNSSPFSHTTGNGGIVEATGTDGSFKYNPPAGFEGADTFTYTVTDAQGKTDTATAQITMTDVVWFVNNTAGACTSNCDGRLTNPLTSLTTLAANSGADPDESFDVIFVHTGTASYTSGIALETNQRLVGQGVSLDTELAAFSITVPTHSIARPGAGTNPTIANGGAGGGITLATDNTIKGLTINGTVAAAIGIQDGNGSVGNLVIDNASLTGTGKAVDIDQGGTLAVDFDQLSSAGSASEGIHLQGVGGTFTAATGTIQTSTGTGVLIGAAAGGTASSGGAVNFTYGGDISSPGGSVVEIQDRTGGTVTFSGAITEGSIGAGLTGILIDGSAGTINFNGQTFLSAGAGTGNGVTLTNNSGTINFAATGTGLDITTTSGSGLTFTGGGTLNITGAANSVVTSTGQIMNLSGTMGTSGIAFQTLTSGTVAAGNAININNLDAAGAGTFSGGAVTIGGTGGASTDGINITASNSTFSFASATIDNTAGDGIEINGTTPNLTGAVTFTTVNLDGMGGVGVNIVGATNAVNINGGTIGATNDPAGDGVNVNGGTGAVTVAAAVTKTTLGNEVVDISTHNTGAISFTVAIAANSGGGGIRIVDNTGGTIGFSGDVTLNTGTLNALTFTNTAGTGATVSFTEGSIDIDTTSGTGINATNSTIGAGSLTISGASNTVAASTGRAINGDAAQRRRLGRRHDHRRLPQEYRLRRSVHRHRHRFDRRHGRHHPEYRRQRHGQRRRGADRGHRRLPGERRQRLAVEHDHRRERRHDEQFRHSRREREQFHPHRFRVPRRFRHQHRARRRHHPLRQRGRRPFDRPHRNRSVPGQQYRSRRRWQRRLDRGRPRHLRLWRQHAQPDDQGHARRRPGRVRPQQSEQRHRRFLSGERRHQQRHHHHRRGRLHRLARRPRPDLLDRRHDADHHRQEQPVPQHPGDHARRRRQPQHHRQPHRRRRDLSGRE